ncbi:uncharacterized protein LOC132195036 isoform X2 [Neocloeon triangulifer]|uniref:uncharacterized protein LOC132195036 isoform X2 n=1 Tax=Neocloeon triangulifer TaxID=2078957 RepID=UPI00286F0381|nr:uncharacterized protein LOC132195036 isoform X2 [Neocloeon triangulifer]
MQFFTKILEFSRSFFSVNQTQRDTTKFMEVAMQRVNSYELCMVDLKDIVQRHESEIKLNQEANLQLLNAIQEQLEIRMNKCSSRLNTLENKMSSQSEQLKAGMDGMKAQLLELHKNLDSLANSLSNTEIHSGEQYELLENATTMNASKLKELMTLVMSCSHKLREHVHYSKHFAENLDQFLGRQDIELGRLRDEMMAQRCWHDKEIFRLAQEVARVGQAKDQRDAEFSILREQRDKLQEEQKVNLKVLEGAVQENRQEIEKAVDVIMKLNLFQVDGPSEETKSFKEDMVKVTARLSKLELDVKGFLCKLNKYLEQKSNGNANTMKEMGRIFTRLESLEKDMNDNVKQEIEKLKKEKSELTKEVRHLKKSRGNENGGDVDLNLKNRRGALEKTAVSADLMKKEQDVFQSTRLKQKVTKNQMTQVNKQPFNFVESKSRPLCSPIEQITKSWMDELENTVDEDTEKQTVLKKLTINKSLHLPERALALYGDQLLIQPPRSEDFERRSFENFSLKNATRRIISSKLPVPKRINIGNS